MSLLHGSAAAVDFLLLGIIYPMGIILIPTDLKSFWLLAIRDSALRVSAKLVKRIASNCKQRESWSASRVCAFFLIAQGSRLAAEDVPQQQSHDMPKQSARVCLGVQAEFTIFKKLPGVNMMHFPMKTVPPMHTVWPLASHLMLTGRWAWGASYTYLPLGSACKQRVC